MLIKFIILINIKNLIKMYLIHLTIQISFSNYDNKVKICDVFQAARVHQPSFSEIIKNLGDCHSLMNCNLSDDV